MAGGLDWEASDIEGHSVDARKMVEESNIAGIRIAGAESKTSHFGSLQGQAVRNLARAYQKIQAKI